MQLKSNSNSVVEAQSSVNQLTSLVQQILESNQELSRRLARMELRALGSSPNHMEVARQDTVKNDDESVLTVKFTPTDDPSQHSSHDSAIPEVGFAFEMDLQASRPNTRVFRRPDYSSAASSAIDTIGWSCLSSLSMADVSDISVIGLPVDASALWNQDHYSFNRQNRTRRHTIPTTASKGKLAPRSDPVSRSGSRRLQLSGILNKQTPESDKRKQGVSERSPHESTAPYRKILLLGEVPGICSRRSLLTQTSW